MARELGGKPTEPDLLYLQALRSWGEEFYAEQNEQIREARKDREMRRPASEGVPGEMRLVDIDPRDPAVAQESFRTTATLSLNRPKLAVTSGGPNAESDRAQELNTRISQFTENCLWTAGSRGEGTDTLRDLEDAALHDGAGWCKLEYDKKLWASRWKVSKADESDAADLSRYAGEVEYAKQEAGPPLVWSNVDALTLNPVWGGGKVQEMLEVTQRPLRATFRRYRLRFDQTGDIVPAHTGEPMNEDTASNLPDMITFLEYTDDVWKCYAVVGSNTKTGEDTGQIVSSYRHGYPFGLPYDVAYGLTMSHFTNRKVGWGIAETKRWLTAYRSYLRYMHAQYVSRDMLTPLVDTASDAAKMLLGDDGKPIVREKGPQPGQIVYSQPGHALAPIQYAQPATLERHIILIDAAIEKLESPQVDSLSGLEGAGFAISQVLNWEMTRIGPIGRNIEILLKKQTRKLWDIIRYKIQDTVWAEQDSENGSYLHVEPDDLKGPLGIRWHLNPERPTDALIKVRAVNERLGKTLDNDSAIEYLAGNDDAWNRAPDEIRRGLARDRIRTSPAYQMWQDEVVFAKAGRGDLLAKAAEAEKAALQGSLPQQVQGAAQPGQAGAPPPGTMVPGGPNPNGVTPDQGNLAMSPNGVGARPPTPSNGNLGLSPGVVAPTNAMR